MNLRWLEAVFLALKLNPIIVQDRNSSSENQGQIWKNLKHDMLDAIRLVLLVIFGITGWGYYHFIQKGIDALGLAIISGACIISVAITFLRR